MCVLCCCCCCGCSKHINFRVNLLKINALMFGGVIKKSYLCNVRNEEQKSPDSSTVTVLHRGKVFNSATKVAKVFNSLC